MPYTVYLIAFIAALGVMAIFYGLSQRRRASADLQTRLAEYGVVDPGGAAAAGLEAPPANFRERLARIFQPAADRIGQGDIKKGKPSLQDQLAKADLKLRTSEYLGIQIGLTVLLFLIGFIRFGGIYGIAQALIMGIVGYFIPGFYVKFRQRRRLKAFNNQLGDTLLLLSNALKAGYSFAQAIDTVSKNASPPIAEEFARCVREMNLGGSVEESLSHMVKRIESDDLDLMVTAVAIHRTVGGNLAEILDNIAFTIRERVRIKGQISTLTASARSSGQLITSLPIVLAVFMYFATPTYFKPMTEQPVGWIIIIIAIVMILIGNFVMGKVTAIEV
ncbi:MAG TPA: type II secretion system F family protein [Candidatus Dormibacteraeota bacterium]|jgi:tight adherence protein B